MTTYISMNEAKSTFTTRAASDGMVTIGWQEGKTKKSRTFPRSQFYQIGKFHNQIAMERAAEAGYTVNELTKYARTGKDLAKDVKALGGVDHVADILGVSCNDLEVQIAQGNDEVDPIYALAIRVLMTSKNKQIVKNMATS